MKLRWVVAVLLFVASCSLCAFAGSPTIGVLDPSCPTSGNGNSLTPGAQYFEVGSGKTTDIMFDNFSSSSNGGGIFVFCNLGTVAWTSTDFATTNFGGFATGSWTFTGSETDPTNSPILCSAGFGTQQQSFLSCTVDISESRVLLEFSGTSDGVNGIQPNAWMTITLNDKYSLEGNTGAWLNADGSPVEFAGGANLTDPNSLMPPVPEPASLVLLASGLAAGIFRRRGIPRR